MPLKLFAAKSYKSWLLSVIIAVTLGTIAIVIINCIVDPYGILRRNFSRQFREPNHNFVKTKYLLSGTRFDSLLMGSSRVNFIDTAKINHGIYYNYWYSEGLPAEHLANIKLLIRRGINIRNLIIGLDDFSYQVDPNSHKFDLLRQPHPFVTGKDFLTFYSEYFLRLDNFFSNIRKYALHNLFKRGKVRSTGGEFDIYNSGRMIVPKWDEQIEKDIASHINSNKFLKPTHYKGDNVRDTLQKISELRALAAEHGIHLTVFFNPIHKTTYLDTDHDKMFYFKKKLADILDFYDFSGLNSITTNNYYYYETSHYRLIVGDMMLKRMFGYPSQVRVPSDFGVLVTKKNVDHHIKMLRRQLQINAYKIDNTNIDNFRDSDRHQRDH